MKQKFLNLCIIALLLLATGCTSGNQTRKVDTSQPVEESTDEIEAGTVKLETNTFNVTVGNITYTADLYETPTAEAFQAKLPFTYEMTELNGNEKYYNLDTELPTSEEISGEIHAGDIMLYGTNCLVLFYKDFTTEYQYSPIGRIQDPTGLADALGTGNVQVSFN